MAEKKETVLYLADVRPLKDPALWAPALERVPPQRRQKAEAFLRPSDARLCLGAGVLLQAALEQAGIPAEKQAFSVSEQGKPYLTDGGVQFSLSHSGDYALCAVSDGPVGCDLQKTGPARMKTARRFFCPSEYELLLAQPEPEMRDLMFCRLWTLKESWLKARGTGIFSGMNGMELRFDAQNCPCPVSDGEAVWTFWEYSDLSWYGCALCVPFGTERPAIRKVRLEELLH